MCSTQLAIRHESTAANLTQHSFRKAELLNAISSLQSRHCRQAEWNPCSSECKSISFLFSWQPHMGYLQGTRPCPGLNTDSLQSIALCCACATTTLEASDVSHWHVWKCQHSCATCSLSFSLELHLCSLPTEYVSVLPILLPAKSVGSKILLCLSALWFADPGRAATALLP